MHVSHAELEKNKDLLWLKVTILLWSQHYEPKLSYTQLKWRSTHAVKPSYLRIFRAQSSVLLYLCASRPFGNKGERNNQQVATTRWSELCFEPVFILHTCIRVLMTSSGVFPKTLVAPAMAPKTPVTKGLIALLGLSPSKEI